MFTTTRLLRFGDCDPSGIAYFPAYLDMLVGVVEEFFESAAISWSDMIRVSRIGTPTLALNLTFLHPGMHGHHLKFFLKVLRVGRSSLDLLHEVRHDTQLLWRAEQRLVATSLDTHKSIPWPDEFRAALIKYVEH